MHRPFRLILVAAAALAAVALAVPAVAVSWASTAYHRTAGWFVDRFDWLVSRIKIDSPRLLEAPRRALLGAVQIMGRMVRRDRPLVSPRWRMCPSV